MDATQEHTRPTRSSPRNVFSAEIIPVEELASEREQQQLAELNVPLPREWGAFDPPLHPHLIRNLLARGIAVPTDIQSRTIPHVAFTNSTVHVHAPTGTGKTLAFLLPLLSRLLPAEYPYCSLSTVSPRAVRAMIVVPTRELAMQIYSVVRELLLVPYEHVGAAKPVVPLQREDILSFVKVTVGNAPVSESDCRGVRVPDRLFSAFGVVISPGQRTACPSSPPCVPSFRLYCSYW